MNESAGRASILFVAGSMGLCAVCAAAYALVAPAGWASNLVVRGLFTVAMSAFLAAMTVALVAGPRTLRARVTRRGVALTACGLLLAALYLVAPRLWYARSVSRIEEIQASGRGWKADLRQKLESGQVPEPMRERMWQIYARAVYQDEGISVEVPQAGGAPIAFEPTDSDVAARQSYLETLERLQPPAGQARGAAIWVALCLAFGLLWPPRRSPAPADPGGAVDKSGTGPVACE